MEVLFIHYESRKERQRRGMEGTTSLLLSVDALIVQRLLAYRRTCEPNTYRKCLVDGRSKHVSIMVLFAIRTQTSTSSITEAPIVYLLKCSIISNAIITVVRTVMIIYRSTPSKRS